MPRETPNDLVRREELRKLAVEIISTNIYLTLATAGDHPWAAPVYYCADTQLYNFYFSSQLDSRHSKHIVNNPAVAFAIFDSHAVEGSGNGVQGIGTAQLLEKTEDIQHALQYYHSKYVGCTVSDFDETQPYRLFKITAHSLYVLDPHHPVDKRVEVFSR
jgi:uncharacterized protein YhbP (UPF0306 family)